MVDIGQIILEFWGVIVVALVFFVLFVLHITGLFPVFKWLTEFFDLRKRRTRIEELEYLDKIRKENLENLGAYVSFKISSLRHHLKIPAPSVDIQVMIKNSSMLDIIIKKFIYRPSLSGINAKLNTYSHDHEFRIPHQNTGYFDASFTIPDGVAEYLENCKRKANSGKHGRLLWVFKCTAYFQYSRGQDKKKRTIKFTKEWHEIELPSKREIS